MVYDIKSTFFLNHLIKSHFCQFLANEKNFQYVFTQTSNAAV